MSYTQEFVTISKMKVINKSGGEKLMIRHIGSVALGCILFAGALTAKADCVPTNPDSVPTSGPTTNNKTPKQGTNDLGCDDPGGGGGRGGGGGETSYLNEPSQSILDSSFGEGTATSQDAIQLPGVTVTGPPIPDDAPTVTPGLDSNDVGFYQFPLVSGGNLFQWGKQKINDWLKNMLQSAIDKNAIPRTPPVYANCNPLMGVFNNTVSTAQNAEEAGNEMLAEMQFNQFATRDVEVPFADGGIGTFHVVQGAAYHLMTSVTPATHAPIRSWCPNANG